MTTVGIVTGAARGIGLACASRVADMVDVVLVIDQDKSALLEATAHIAGSHRARVEPFVLDITDSQGLTRLANRVAELGALRAVAHAAGISPTMADWKRVLTVDLVGTAMLTNSLRHLVTEKTAIVCLASVVAGLLITSPPPRGDTAVDSPLAEDFLERIHDALGEAIEDPGLAYAWAKRGVQRLVEREALQLGPLGARVCSISPGVIDTPMLATESSVHSPDTFLSLTPLGRKGHADEVAAAVAFLLSDEASFVTGIDLLIDGGMTGTVHSRTDIATYEPTGV